MQGGATVQSGVGLDAGVPTMPSANVGPFEGMGSKSTLGGLANAFTMPADMGHGVDGMKPPSMPPTGTMNTPMTPGPMTTSPPIMQPDQPKKLKVDDPELEKDEFPMKPTPKAPLIPRPPPTSPPEHLFQGPSVPAPAPLHAKVGAQHVPPPRRPRHPSKDDMVTVLIDDLEDDEPETKKNI